jgi:hypothetical protein
MAPAHIEQGSSVTYSVQPLSRYCPAPARRAQRHNLRVGRRVVVAQHAILRRAQDGVLTDDDSANWHFAGLPGGDGLGQRPVESRSRSFMLYSDGD